VCELFAVTVSTGVCVCGSLDLSQLDLDGEGGCKFLRVMLSLIMHDYPQLVCGALELLFRHFSQRQEVLQAFKQVSLETVDDIHRQSAVVQ